MGLSSFIFFSDGLCKTIFFRKSAFWPYKVIQCVCDFLLVPHSNLGPILHRFGDIASFCALFHSNFAGVPVGSDRPC